MSGRDVLHIATGSRVNATMRTSRRHNELGNNRRFILLDRKPAIYDARLAWYSWGRQGSSDSKFSVGPGASIESRKRAPTTR